MGEKFKKYLLTKFSLTGGSMYNTFFFLWRDIPWRSKAMRDVLTLYEENIAHFLTNNDE